MNQWSSALEAKEEVDLKTVIDSKVVERDWHDRQALEHDSEMLMLTH